MSLEEFVRRVERRVCDLGWRLMPAAARNWWTDETERLSDELNKQQVQAQRRRVAARQIRARLAENEVREAVLASQVETYVHTREQARAYELALELDQVRRQLAEDRARLPWEDSAYQTHRDRIAELGRRLASLENKIRPRASV
jgi:hypothetical protein